MILRAIAIIEALAGGVVSTALVMRIANAFIPDDVDPATMTNEQKAAFLVKGARKMIKNQVKIREEQIAADAARLAARADVEGNVGLGDD